MDENFRARTESALRVEVWTNRASMLRMGVLRDRDPWQEVDTVGGRYCSAGWESPNSSRAYQREVGFLFAWISRGISMHLLAYADMPLSEYALRKEELSGRGLAGVTIFCGSSENQGY